MKHIWRILDRDWVVEVSHIYREANKSAYALANVGCNLDLDLKTFEMCPPFLIELVPANMLGVKSPRVISL
jgi:hypothetical protein